MELALERMDGMADSLFNLSEEGELLRRKSLKEGVFELLHQRIVAGKFIPGEWLRQEDISEQLGVSQTPVREALDLLVSVGLAERVPYRGVRVPELTPEVIVDAYILRLILESTAARLAAQNLDAEALQEMEDVVEQTRQLMRLQDMSQHRQLNKRFHLLVAKASGNSLMNKLYEMISNLFPDWRLYEYMFRHPELLESSLSREYQEHKAIVEAFQAHEPELAARQVLVHIHNLRKELVDFLGIPPEMIDEKEAQIGNLLQY